MNSLIFNLLLLSNHSGFPSVKNIYHIEKMQSVMKLSLLYTFHALIAAVSYFSLLKMKDGLNCQSVSEDRLQVF